MYTNDLAQFSKRFSSFTFTDETLAAMKAFMRLTGIFAEPHGAVGYLGLS
jgi:threonine synthase